MSKRRHAPLNSQAVATVRGCVHEMGFLNVSRKVGLNYSHLYRALSADGNPCVSTLMALCDAVGLELMVVPKKDSVDKPVDNNAQTTEQEEQL